MKKIIMLGLIFLSLVVTGCFGPSDSDKIKSKIETKFVDINKGSLNILFAENNDMATNFKHMGLYTQCLAKQNEKVNDTLLELDANNKLISQELLTLNTVLDANVTKKLDSDLASAEGNKERFQSLLSEFKLKLVDKKVNSEILEIMFEGRIKDVANQRDFMKGIMFNVALTRILNPLSIKYPNESMFCVQAVTGLLPLKSLNYIEVVDNNATINITLENDEETFLKMSKEDGNWVFIK